MIGHMVTSHKPTTVVLYVHLLCRVETRERLCDACLQNEELQVGLFLTCAGFKIVYD